MPDMKNLLIEARGEIIDLRRRNEILAAKVFELVLRTKPAIPPHVEGEDVVWKLQQKLRDLDDG